MDKLVIKRDEEKRSSINRTIRIPPAIYDKIVETSEKTGVTFNKIVCKCLEYSLDNLED